MIGSVLLHVTVAILLLISWNFSKSIKVGAVVPVTIVSQIPAEPAPAEAGPVEQQAQAPDPKPEPKPEPRPEPQAAPKPAPPPPKPAPKPTPAPPPKPTPSPTPKPAKVEPPKPTPAKPQPQAQAQPQAKPQKSLDLDALSASISSLSKSSPAKPSATAKGPTQAATSPTPRQTTGTAISGLAMSGLVDALNKHWNPNCAIEGARAVKLRVSFDVDGSGQVVPRSADAHGSENSPNAVVKAAAERAIRSVYTVGAMHLITRDFYGQHVTANFDGNEACPG